MRTVAKLNIERAELSYKISKLQTALHNPQRLKVSQAHINMMILQKQAMIKYREILDDRLKDLEENR